MAIVVKLVIRHYKTKLVIRHYKTLLLYYDE